MKTIITILSILISVSLSAQTVVDMTDPQGLKQARVAANISIKELAENTSLTPEQIKRVEDKDGCMIPEAAFECAHYIMQKTKQPVSIEMKNGLAVLVIEDKKNRAQ